MWETPNPAFWTGHSYAVVRADERGTVQSLGILKILSNSVLENFLDVIKWAAQET